MLDKNTLIKTLKYIDGQDYVNYQALLGAYDFSSFQLIIQHIPKDPFAPSTTGLYRIKLRRSNKEVVKFNNTTNVQTTAFADFLARKFYQACKRISKGGRGTGHSGLIIIDRPGQTILDRSNVIITDDYIEVRCFLGLPANKRIIRSDIAKSMFFSELPAIVESALFSKNIDSDALREHISVAEDSDFIRNNLDSLGLVAFVANDSLLPRESGISDKPLSEDSVSLFKAPASLSHEMNLPYKGLINGLAIKKGVTLIVGGGYHGKSTLLKALETGIYNHIPGDGREYCVSSMQTVKVRAYSGRRVANTDISMFINNLPFAQDTKAFSTENASGSTSQAVNIVEAIEVGAKTLLMDEDTCATNFMIRDSNMQKLVSESDEPITTYIDKVRQLYFEKGISTVLVLGGVGDYFEVSDHVIQMKNYQALDATEKAHSIAKNISGHRQFEGQEQPIYIHDRTPIAKSINPVNDYGKFSIYAKEMIRLNFGKNVIDLTDVEQLMEISQVKAIGYAIEYAKRYMDENMMLREIIEHVDKDIELKGLDILSEKRSGHFAKFRKFELAFVLNRLREIEMVQKEV